MARGEYLHMYTDGSIIDNIWAGCSFVFLTKANTFDGTAISLGRLADITEVEMHGIDAALFFALETHSRMPVYRVDIYTDCLDASRRIQAMIAHKLAPRNELYTGILDSICKLQAFGIAVSVEWIKAHAGTEGNEAADVLAKKGARESIRLAQEERRREWEAEKERVEREKRMRKWERWMETRFWREERQKEEAREAMEAFRRANENLSGTRRLESVARNCFLGTREPILSAEEQANSE